MSFILNALRKSELERKKNQADGLLLAEHSGAVRKSYWRQMPLWLAGFTVLNFALVAYLYLHLRQPLPERGVASVMPEVAIVPRVQTHEQPQGVEPLTISALPFIAPASAPIEPAQPKKPAPSFKKSEANPDSTTALKPPPDKPKNKTLTPNVLAAKESAAVPQAPKPVAQRKVEAVLDEVQPESVAEPAAATLRAPATKPLMPADAAQEFIPLLHNLPADKKAKIPEIKMNVLAYMDKVAERFVIINMTKFKIGDHVKDGVILQEILPESAVFMQDGQRFRVERP